jgi:hypothetical protein
MLRVEAEMRAQLETQLPVLDATAQRGARSLLGLEVGGTGRPTVAVKDVDTDGTLTIRGGLALGLGKGSELVKASNPDVRVRVTSVRGMDESRAEVIGGSISQVETGDLLELDLWAPPEGAHLGVWVPEDRLEQAALPQVAAEIGKLRTSEAITWVNDPTEVGVHEALHVVARDQGAWKLFLPGGRRSVDLGRSLSAEHVAEQLSAPGERPRLFVELPPAQELVASLRFLKDRQSAIAMASEPESAHYWLMGRAVEGGVDYAWVLREAVSGDPGGHIPFPKHTTWVRFEPGSGGLHKLEDEAYQLARVRAWLVLASPPPSARSGRFPYSLVLIAGDREVAGPDDVVWGEELIELRLRANPEALGRRLRKRYVYVFVLDREGRSNLLFPLGAGIGENRLPAVERGEAWPEEISLDTTVRIGEPFGIDTFILLTTEEAIPNPKRTFQWQPVLTHTRGQSEPSSPLGRLIQSAKMGTRGGAVEPIATPSTWTIERIQVLSEPRKAPLDEGDRQPSGG